MKLIKINGIRQVLPFNDRDFLNKYYEISDFYE